MSDVNDPADAANAATTAAALDLSRYRASDLTERFVELISVPRALRTVLTTTVVAALLAAATAWLVLENAKVTLTPALAGCAYSLVIGVVLGGLLGVCRVLLAATANLEEILSIVLRITRQAADDYGSLKSGAVELPAPGELMQQVYEQVLLPAMERSVSGAFGLAASPVLWTYRKTIGTAVRSLVGRVARQQVSESDGARVTAGAERTIRTAAESVEAIQGFTDKAGQILGRTATRIRRFALLPLQAALVVAVVMAAAPLLAICYFFGS